LLAAPPSIARVETPGADTLPVESTRHARKAKSTPFLFVAMECERPLAAPSRHSLADVDAVIVGRGETRSVQRVVESGERRLVVRIPDSRMSGKHAELLCALGRWSVRDAGSTNGTAVNGVKQPSTELADGDLIETGHTLFVFRVLAADDDGPPDFDAARAPAAPGLATVVPHVERELALLVKLAASNVAIVIHAESGAGKELAARAAHALSGRTGAFVAVNCGAIPESLVETELFGYRKGAFSGAADDRPGLIRAAHQGTLFLDEIGDLPAASQAAFLRALQEREIVPVGATRPIPVDIRVVAASHRDLQAQVEAGRFRADLFARISGYTVRLPPLRERREDIGLLVGSLLPRVAGAGASRVTFTPAAARALFRYAWPLNVRELEKCLETAVVLAGGDAVQPAHLPDAVRATKVAPPTSMLTDAEKARRAEIVGLLREHGGNVSAVARAMGKARMQIQRWMKAYAIDPDRLE
jgi:transcriptional regulator of acetoin/glycerol metabolism